MANGQGGNQDIDYKNPDAVRAHIAELQSENDALREQVRGLKRLLKVLKPAMKRLDVGRLRAELQGLVGGDEVMFLS